MEYCRHCPHCRRNDELLLAALEQEEKENLARSKEKKRQEKKRAEEVRNGIVHGHCYEAYNEEEIRRIKDLDFLREMRFGMTPSAQPPTEWDFEELTRRQLVVQECIEKLEK